MKRKRWITATLCILTVLFPLGSAYATTPTYSVCNTLAGDDVGLYVDYGNGTDAIYIDDCKLTAFGGGQYDRDTVLAHEQGHASGLVHGDGGLMEPVIYLTGT